jgi:hypothetical protein
MFRTMNSFSSFVRNVAPAARINFGTEKLLFSVLRGL